MEWCKAPNPKRTQEFLSNSIKSSSLGEDGISTFFAPCCFKKSAVVFPMAMMTFPSNEAFFKYDFALEGLVRKTTSVSGIEAFSSRTVL